MDWLMTARSEAEKRFQSLPFPSAKDENFRFTPMAEMPVSATIGVPSFSAMDEGELALLSLSGEGVNRQGSIEGFTLSALNQASVEAKKYLSECLFAEDKFAQMAVARWKNGGFFHVPANTKLLPVRIECNSSASEQIRHLIVLEEGAEAVLVQESHGNDSEKFVNELCELQLGKNARLHWILVQRHGSATTAFTRQMLRLAQGAHLRITSVQIGGAKAQVRQEIHLEGVESSIEMKAAVRGSADQHFDFWTEVKHSGLRSKSDLAYSYVMSDKSRSVFNGLIHIEKNASDCEAAQKAKSLLLSTQATVHAIPKLIIQTDAVKCSHGASVSSINPEQVHYLQSRGIAKPEAERMIIRGFTEPVLVELPTEALYARVEEKLLQKEGALS